jgi:1-acyl-sn-glycerol-3-phosphate acyltransferase
MLRNLFCIVFTAFWTALIGILGLLHALFARRSAYVTFVASRIWSPGLLWAGGAKLLVEGLENIPQNKAVVFASNHQSTVDIPVLFSVLPLNVRFIAKHVLGHVPFLGWYLRLARFILINRSNRKKAMQQLERAAEQIRAGTSIIVFPEGTRSETGEILPFKKGTFVLALSAGVPICPIAIEGSGRLMPKNSWNIRPGLIRVRIGPPVDISAFRGEPLQLAEHRRQKIIQQNVALGGKGGALLPPPSGCSSASSPSSSSPAAPS